MNIPLFMAEDMLTVMHCSETWFDQLCWISSPCYKRETDAVIRLRIWVMESSSLPVPEMDIHARYADDDYECNFSEWLKRERGTVVSGKEAFRFQRSWEASRPDKCYELKCLYMGSLCYCYSDGILLDRIS